MEKSKLDFINRVRQHWLLRNFILGKEVLDFIACQFALESNYGTSRLANVDYNFCGMKIPRQRVSYRKGVVGDFSSYASIDDCIKDYISWLFYQRPNNMQLTYLNSFMLLLRNSGYCPVKGYVERIYSIYLQLNS